MSVTRKLILASASPRRRELLAEAGLVFDVLVSGVEERHVPGESPQAYVLRNAREKAGAVCGLPEAAHHNAVVLGSDTIVVSPEGHILEKPHDAADARRMLRLLSGQTHRVYTAIALLQAPSGDVLHEDVVSTEVTFRPISEAELDAYLATGEPFDKAGAYGVQGKAAVFVRSLSGSYTNVVGMPVCEVVEALRLQGFSAFAR